MLQMFLMFFLITNFTQVQGTCMRFYSSLMAISLALFKTNNNNYMYICGLQDTDLFETKKIRFTLYLPNASCNNITAALLVFHE